MITISKDGSEIQGASNMLVFSYFTSLFILSFATTLVSLKIHGQITNEEIGFICIAVITFIQMIRNCNLVCYIRQAIYTDITDELLISIRWYNVYAFILNIILCIYTVVYMSNYAMLMCIIPYITNAYYIDLMIKLRQKNLATFQC